MTLRKFTASKSVHLYSALRPRNL